MNKTSSDPARKGRRFDQEFNREAAPLASQPGETDEPVGRDLGAETGD